MTRSSRRAESSPAPSRHRAHRTHQLEEGLAAGPEYDDQDLVATTVFGKPVHPETLSWYFGRAVKKAGLSAIRLHDHANVGITLDTYSHVAVPMQTEAASVVAGLITSKIDKPSRRSGRSGTVIPYHMRRTYADHRDRGS